MTLSHRWLIGKAGSSSRAIKRLHIAPHHSFGQHQALIHSRQCQHVTVYLQWLFSCPGLDSKFPAAPGLAGTCQSS
ncbi:hypothetical protein OEZ85_002440 [Tetradesmus obliquus]|uniref:Uncharacterized protein n=1 Tax=Tetradesmus obliquus TaxID=3088 RepID=A0ABY8TZS4_TETOB|nr:hypothetical protein OEZ85_002440 [Tetradesmus obliquus]